VSEIRDDRSGMAVGSRGTGQAPNRRIEEGNMPTWLIWVIVIAIVVLVVIALVALTSRRRTEQRRARAGELREEASARGAELSESHRQADELRARADLAKSEAARAEEQAANAEQGHRIEQAGYEDKVREADRLDPEVDDQAQEYEPDVWNDERSETPRGAQPRETTTAQRAEDPEADARS